MSLVPKYKSHQVRMYVSKQTWFVTTTSVRVVASVCLNATLMFADGSEVNGIRMCTVSGAPDQVE